MDLRDFFNQNELPPIPRRMFESMLNISIASLGGVIAGISIARRQNSSTNMVNYVKKHKAAYIDHNLPSKWGIACGGFVGIMDVVIRWICPVTESLKYINKSNEMSNEIIGTIGDSTIGGAVAGALFKGSAITSDFPKRRVLNRNVVANIKVHGFWNGLVPGMILGCVCGVSAISFMYMQRYVEGLIGEQELLEREMEEQRDIWQERQYYQEDFDFHDSNDTL